MKRLLEDLADRVLVLQLDDPDALALFHALEFHLLHQPGEVKLDDIQRSKRRRDGTQVATHGGGVGAGSPTPRAGGGDWRLQDLRRSRRSRRFGGRALLDPCRKSHLNISLGIYFSHMN